LLCLFLYYRLFTDVEKTSLVVLFNMKGCINEMTIENKVVIITGASSGIGEATAKLLAEKGAKVVLGARREEHLVKLVEEINSNGGQAAYRVTDVVTPDDSQQLVQLALQGI
jgi:NADP-dependent 3-hydroxy acid dehydrogenase YdfG